MNFTNIKQRLKSDGTNQLFLLIVLIGILPAIEDFSLFAIFGFSITHFNIHQEFQLLYTISLATIPIGLLLLLGQKNYYRIFGLLPVFFAAYIHLMGESFSLLIEKHEALIGILHFLCYKIAFLYFITKGKMRSFPFLITLILIWVLLDFQHLVLFLTYTGLIRFLYFAIVQNINIFKETGIKRSSYLTFKSFLYWSPLLIFIIPSAIFSSKMNKAAIDQIYDKSFIESTNPDRKYKRDQFEKDLNCSVASEAIRFHDSISLGMKKINKIVTSNTDKLPNEVSEVYKGIFKETLPEIAPVFKKEDCGFWGKLNITCQLKNSAKEGINDSYKEQRQDMLKSLITQVEISMQNTKNGVDSSVDDVDAMLKLQLNSLVKKFKLAVQSSFDTMIFINLLLDIAFGFLILKSFLYVFSRVAFSSDDENYVTLLSSENKMKNGALHKLGNQYAIAQEKDDLFYVSRSFEPSGRAPKFSLPQWKSAIIARVLSGNYAMNKIVVNSKSEAVHFKAMGSHEFVEWDIKEGEEIVFHFSNFVGMSQHIKISAVVSLRLTSLLFGRLIFTTAKGPGKLILLTKGEPITAMDPRSNASIATSRILAWQRNTRFNVESELNIVDVFMSGIYLKKKKEDLILIDADVKGRAKNGIVRFIKSFILPI
ncbi:AIM24 family protein [Aquimarina pacifica]|uniref:AIM24 family protein n=1 Tax=Aquimarina pacifica TaxID=1296415 RepID=UPI00046FA3F4|nr:AIM24 family protein [Aquimarina pacifica]